MTARPPTNTYRGKLATPKASNCMPRLGSCSPRAEDAKVYGYCTLAHPPSRTYPITVHSSRVEKAEPSLREITQTQSDKETPESRCGSPSLEVEQPPANRLSHSHDSREGAAVSAHDFKQKPPMTQIRQKQAQDGAQTRARVTEGSHRTRGRETRRRRDGLGTRKVSRGASRRRCKHGRTTSSQRRPKTQVCALGCQTVVGELDAGGERGGPKNKSHEVHLGEGANTGAQLLTGEDSKRLRRRPIVGGGDGRRWHRQEEATL